MVGGAGDRSLTGVGGPGFPTLVSELRRDGLAEVDVKSSSCSTCLLRLDADGERAIGERGRALTAVAGTLRAIIVYGDVVGELVRMLPAKVLALTMNDQMESK